MNNFLKSSLSLITIVCLVFFSSCKEDPELPDNLVEFESNQLGINADESELTIKISLSREVSEAAS